MKKYFAAILAVLMLLSLFAGCAQPPPADGSSGTATTADTTPTTQPGEKPLNAEITLWTLPMVSEGYDGLIEDIVLKKLAETQPGIKVNVELLTWEGGPEKLQIALGTGSTPDLYIDGTARTAALPAKGVCVDVTDVVDEFRDRFVPVLTEIGVIDGKNYLFPSSAMAPVAFMYNKTLAQELGTYDMIPKDGYSWTLDEFYEFLKASTVPERGIYGTGLYAGSATGDIQYYAFMYANDGYVLSEDRGTSTADSAEVVEIVDFFGRLVSEGIAAPGAATMKGEDITPLFYNSQIVCLFSGSISYYTQMLKMAEEGQIDKEFECILTLPPNKGTPRTLTWGGNFIALFKNDEDADRIAAAKEFLRAYALSDELHIETAKRGSYLPCMADLKVTIDNPGQQALLDQVMGFGGYASAFYGVLEPYWPEVRNNFYPELQSVFSGTKTAQAAMDTFKANVDAVLAAQ